MAREINKLNARLVTTITKSGRHGDGGGLYLVVDKGGAKRWVFLYRRQGKLREMGLGGLSRVSLAKARELARESRELLQAGCDPIETKNAEQISVPTFGEVADQYIETMTPQFRNAKHIAQWKMTLTKYAAPLRGLPVDEVTSIHVLAVLQPLWLTKSETGSRLRGRIERVLDAAKAKGYRSGENPALWRGHLSNLLPKPQKLKRGHHASMPFKEVPEFIEALRARDAVSARALEFTILTAARSGEAYGATWSEIDFDTRVWTIPAERMKANRIHRVPLAKNAVEILMKMRAAKPSPSEHLFPGQKSGRPLSSMAMEMILRRMGVVVTVHGFRSSFRDWCGEITDHPREVAESALSHVIGDATEQAYRRGDSLDKRRILMADWADYCAGTSSLTHAER